ncbi:MAG TPA: hypothetical protein PKL31_12465 [Fulvivirga sp.]|nr:hypothetical protein [Fulvivirga sp.]
MKKIISLILLAGVANFALCQTRINKTIATKNGQNVSMNFTWPDLIQVNTWDKNEIKIEALVSINQGQNDGAFKLQMDEAGGSLNIYSEIENHETLPKKIMIRSGGEEYFFNTDDRNSPEVVRFLEEKGSSGYEFMNYGVIKDIKLVVHVPANINLDIYSKYGMVEVVGYTGNLHVHSKFGGVDVTVPVAKNTIKAGTKFGKKYTNLDQKFDVIAFGDSPGKWDWVSCAINGGGAEQEFKSEFGNIYIRK